MKKCTKCKIERELSEFCKDKTKKDGLQSNCRSCKKQYKKENAEKIREQKKQYRQENADKILEHKKQYRQENAEKIRERDRQYYQENIDKMRKSNREYRQSLKDGLHHVYYLPNHNYVGCTNCIPRRMEKHRWKHGRTTDNYQILASFEDREKALRFESLLHDSGFEGRHYLNLYR